MRSSIAASRADFSIQSDSGCGSHLRPVVLLGVCGLIAVLALSALVVLPQAAVAQASADPNERLLVGVVNDYRAEAGVQPVQLSETLSHAAQQYADHLVSQNISSGHNADGRTPQQRAAAVGWPEPDFVMENVGISENGRSAADTWYYEGPAGGHYQIMFAADRATIGTGQRGGVYVAMFGRTCPAGAEAGCALTGDFGDAAIQPPPLVQQPDPLAKRSPGLELGTPRASSRHTVTLRALTRTGADGRLTMRITGPGGYREYVKPATRSGRAYTFRTRIKRRGRFTLQVRFTGAAGWSDATRRRTVRVR
jgi:hypothetical protein